ncbi:MurR/RpiR family transcriptional regulator [Agrococcus casei]|uniref:MurR/RpiR family transcriptional regulator n=1 Tax=Agrococcus casei TaxID=343512 RepID=UPI003F8F993E
MTEAARKGAEPIIATRTAMPALRPAERRVAQLLLDDPAGFSKMSAGSVARAVSTSSTTVIRFQHAIGYERFVDLRHDLALDAARERRATESIPAEPLDIQQGDTLKQVIAKIARDETLSIAETADVLSSEALAEAVEVVTEATRVDIFGIGASGIAATDFQRKLTRIGRIAIEWSDAHAAWTSASVLETGAVAIAISHSGRTFDTIEYLRLARAAGAKTVVITNFPDSPIAEHADVVLQTAARESPLRSGALGSRIAQLMVIDALFVGVVQQRYDESMVAIRTSYAAVRQAT